MNRKLIVTILVLSLTVTMASAGIAPGFAKQTDMPPGSAIMYCSGGFANVNIGVLNFRFCTNIHIYALDVESGTFGSGDGLLLVFEQNIPTTPPQHFTIPFAYISTNDEAIDFYKMAFSGTAVYRHKTGIPDLDNTRLVSTEELSVERHGNTIIVDFDPKDPMTLDMPASLGWPIATYPFDLPAFHMEWSKIGGSIHTSTVDVIPYVPSLGLSGYTLPTEIMGFIGDATFNCPVWNNKGVPETIANSKIVMHGIKTFVPP
jgi:hypothetical protein